MSSCSSAMPLSSELSFLATYVGFNLSCSFSLRLSSYKFWPKTACFDSYSSRVTFLSSSSAIFDDNSLFYRFSLWIAFSLLSSSCLSDFICSFLEFRSSLIAWILPISWSFLSLLLSCLFVCSNCSLVFSSALLLSYSFSFLHLYISSSDSFAATISRFSCSMRLSFSISCSNSSSTSLFSHCPCLSDSISFSLMASYFNSC